MNLRETQQLLTMIWSMYPNAPRLSREDKEVMAMAWLGLMYEYSLEDVWKAARQCFEAEPRFIPTAPEVMRRCTKNYKVERYLPPEYAELTTGIDLTFNANIQRENLKRALAMRAQERDLDEGERTMLAEIEMEQARIREIDRIWGEAYETARIAYEQAERAKLVDDGAEKRLKQLAII